MSAKSGGGREESFPAYLERYMTEELSHLDSSVRIAAIAYFLGVSTKTVSEWLRGAGPRAPVGQLYRVQLEHLRAIITRTERELGRNK